MTWSEAMEMAFHLAPLALSERRRLRVCAYRDAGRWQYTVQRTPVPELVTTSGSQS